MTTPLLCFACGYDVSRTVSDGIDACPECGLSLDDMSLAYGRHRMSAKRAVRDFAVVNSFFVFIGASLLFDSPGPIAATAWVVPPMIMCVIGALCAMSGRPDLSGDAPFDLRAGVLIRYALAILTRSALIAACVMGVVFAVLVFAL